MCRFRVITLSLAAMAIASVTGAQQSDKQAPKIFTLSGEMLRGYQGVQRNLVEAAEKMPEANYSFKPTPEIRPFGQLVAHAALTQFGTCSLLKGEPSPRTDEKEDAPRTRAEATSCADGRSGRAVSARAVATCLRSLKIVKPGP